MCMHQNIDAIEKTQKDLMRSNTAFGSKNCDGFRKFSSSFSCSATWVQVTNFNFKFQKKSHLLASYKARSFDKDKATCLSTGR